MVAERFDDAYIPDIIPKDDLDYMDQGGYGARMGWGERPAVLVVDMLEIFASSDHLGRSESSGSTISETKRLLSAAREADLPVFYTRLADDETTLRNHRGIIDEKKDGAFDNVDIDAASTIHPELTPEDGDVVLEKPKLSAFFDTHLANVLRLEGIDTLVIVGLSTSGGVRSSVVDANCHNIRPIVPAECVGDRSEISHEVTLFNIDMKFGDVESVSDTVNRISEYQ
ncbi:isochorismatase family protein [Natrialba swarupiae]|uniref:Isochorismatase family protein n=1 Tax=Natrialba swarupiae TaxID=2448032 RepID=A0A5D5ANG8_9EURY|nr:isochorismatase family protein [Natrialba swarupiae]TYT62634.1 isochorismatase family protein [Natrialba swarupiae]